MMDRTQKENIRIRRTDERKARTHSPSEGKNESCRTDVGKTRTLRTDTVRILVCLLFAIFAFEVFSIPGIRLSFFLPKHNKSLTIGCFYGGTGPGDFEGVQNTILLAIGEYQKKYPDVEVQFEKGIPCEGYSEWLMGKYLEGKEPDVFIARQEDLSVLTKKNMLMPLQDEPVQKMKAFYPPLVDACRWDGILYALPVMCNPQMMAVNIDFLRTYVGNDPSPEWSWGDFHQMCRICTGSSVKAQDYPRYGVTGYTWEMAAASNGAKLFDEYGVNNYLDELKCVQAVTYHHSLNDLMTEMVDFTSGQTAFSPMWASDWRKYSTPPFAATQENGFSWYCTTMPAGPGGGNISRTELLAGAVSRRSTCREDAVHFLEILAGNDTVQQSVLDETWCLPASSKILPRFVSSNQSSVDSLKYHPSADKSKYQTSTGRLKSTYEASAVDYGLLDQILNKAVVIRRFKGYEEILHKLDSEIREAGNNSGNFAVSLRRISNTMETYTGKQ